MTLSPRAFSINQGYKIIRKSRNHSTYKMSNSGLRGMSEGKGPSKIWWLTYICHGIWNGPSGYQRESQYCFEKRPSQLPYNCGGLQPFHSSISNEVQNRSFRTFAQLHQESGKLSEKVVKRVHVDNGTEFHRVFSYLRSRGVETTTSTVQKPE